MKSPWVKMIVYASIALSLSACSTGGASTPMRQTLPAEETTPSSSAPDENNSAIETPSPQPALTPTKEFQVDNTLAPEPDGQEQTVKNTTVLPTPGDPNQAKLVQQAKADLATRLGIPAGQIDLVAFESVEWPDGSLGCPQPGMAYIQVMVDGLLIRFQAGGQFYEYHSGGERAPFLCEKLPGQ